MAEAGSGRSASIILVQSQETEGDGHDAANGGMAKGQGKQKHRGGAPPAAAATAPPRRATSPYFPQAFQPAASSRAAAAAVVFGNAIETVTRQPPAELAAGNASITLVDDASDSDIEVLLPVPTSAQRPPGALASASASTTTKKKRRRPEAGEFKTAASLLKEGACKAKHKLASSPSAPRAPGKGAQKDVFHGEDDGNNDDDEILELPPPLRRASPLPVPDENHMDVMSDIPLLHDDSSASSEMEFDSPATLFRNKISTFRAPALARKPSGGSRSLFSIPPSSTNTIVIATESNTLLADSSTANATASTSAIPDSIPPPPPAQGKKGRKVKKEVPVDQLAPPLLVIPTPFLSIITACPVCTDAWTTTKTTNFKLAHIRKCATARGFVNDTVNQLAERQVRAAFGFAEEARRRMQEERTLFETIVSKKGKEVLVVGVEQKQKQSHNQNQKAKPSEPAALVGNDTASGVTSISDIENARPGILPQVQPQALAGTVLYTQGGSAHSQATHTQVQRELNGKIKVNQKVTRGDFVSVLQPNKVGAPPGLLAGVRGGSGKDGAASAGAGLGAGSKAWQKAEEILREKDETASGGGADTFAAELATTTKPAYTVSFGRTGKLESFNTSRFRLAEKARRVAAARTIVIASPVTSASESDSDVGTARTAFRPLAPLSKAQALAALRPYRNTGRRTVSLVDSASEIALNLDYDLWELAGATVDVVPDRIVNSSPPPSFSPSPLHRTPSGRPASAALSGWRSPALASSAFMFGRAARSPSSSAMASSTRYASALAPSIPSGTSRAASNGVTSSGSSSSNANRAALASQTTSSSAPSGNMSALQALTARMEATRSRTVNPALQRAREERNRRQLATSAPPPPSDHSSSADGRAGRVKREIKDEDDDAAEPEKKVGQQTAVKREERVVLEIDSDSASSAEIALAGLSVSTPNKNHANKRAEGRDTNEDADTAPTPASPDSVQATQRTTNRTTKDAPSSASPKSETAKLKAKAKKLAGASTMPDYASWDREDLRLATASYGYKASSSKTVLVEQMERIWRAIHPEDAIPNSIAAKTASAKSPGKARKPLVLAAAAAAAAGSSGSASASPKASPKKRAVSSKAGATASRAKKAVASPLSRRSRSRSPVASASAVAVRKRRKSVAELADAEVDTDSEVQELKTAGETLREAILADEAFYLRLLRYEPICFTDFEDIAAKHKVKISKIALRDWLDSQAIIFYYPQDQGRNANRSGVRKRHA